MQHLLLFLVGLVGLWLGAELITRGALQIARAFGWSESFIGLTVLALGTDFPEIMVAVTGAIKQNAGEPTSGIVIGNIIGSSMAQIGLVMGLVGLIHVMKIKKSNTWSHGLMLIITTFVFYILSQDGVISRNDGLVFLSLYALYFIFINRTIKRLKFGSRFKKKKPRPSSWIKLFIGLGVIAEASHLVVTNGVDMAVDLGVSQMVVGVILVGIGTSLPELVVSLNAAIKGASELSVSNLVGSNIVDILIALGGSALITDWQLDRRVVTFDLPFLLFTSVVVVLFFLTKQKLERKESTLILGLYVVYVTLKIGGF